MATFNIHAQTWNALSGDEQSRVEHILKSTTLLKDGDHLHADPNAPAITNSEMALGNPFCTIACGVAEAAAVAACGTLTGPAAALCIAAAHEAANYCRSRC
ncbi:hypothetical protein BH10ACI4_BH10ACI4_11660 [soil metagenome]